MDADGNPNLETYFSVQATPALTDPLGDRFADLFSVVSLAIAVRVLETFQWVTYNGDEQITLRVCEYARCHRVFFSAASCFLSDVTASRFISGMLTAVNVPSITEPVIIPFLQSFFNDTAQADASIGRNLLLVAVDITYYTNIICEGDMIDEVLSGDGRPYDFIFRHGAFLSPYPGIPLAFGALVMELYGGPESMVCSICLDEVPIGAEVACLECEHKFHFDCVLMWFLKSISCPLCRFMLPLRGMIE